MDGVIKFKVLDFCECVEWRDFKLVFFTMMFSGWMVIFFDLVARWVDEHIKRRKSVAACLDLDGEQGMYELTIYEYFDSQTQFQIAAVPGLHVYVCTQSFLCLCSHGAQGWRLFFFNN